MAKGDAEREEPVKRLGAADANVLVVDDVESNLVALEAVLQPLGCNVIRATSGQQALKELLFRDVAVLLLDVMMPGLDGLTTAGLIKKRPASRHTPIIFLTAKDTRAQEMALGYAQGAVDYLIKPVDPDILRSKVAVFVELFLKRQELEVQTEIAQRREREAIENRRLYESERGARAQAEAIARAREDMIAVVSHDLRSPMTALATSAQVIKRRLAQGNTSELTAPLETIERSILRMDSLVNDLLDTARIQSGTLTLEMKVEAVAPMVQQIAEQLRLALSAKEQSLNVSMSSPHIYAMCDRNRIFQVISNLVENASKFSAAKSSIGLEVVVEAGEVLFTVSDHGCGISSEQLPHIFEPYWQASQQRKRGLGLGLAIVKGIVEAHQTRIWVESQVGAGSRFYFTLASAEEAAESGGGSPDPPS